MSPSVGSGSKMRLERSGDSMPHLGGAGYDNASSRHSVMSLIGNAKMNQSMDMLKPMKPERSLMKLTGSNIMGNSGLNRGSTLTIDHAKIPELDKSRTMKNVHAGISVQDMLQKEAKAQFDGTVARYPVPDTMAKLYRIHGQVDMSLSKKPKETYITQIFNK
jgi:hypothetical protein